MISPRSLRLASRDFSLVFGEKKDGFILFIFWGSSSLIARSPLAIWWLEGGGIPCRFPRVAWRISYLLAQIASEEHAFPLQDRRKSFDLVAAFARREAFLYNTSVEITFGMN